MLFNVPQFINKEDKLVGPLTAKQLGWMLGGGAVLLVLWNLLDFPAFIIASIPVSLATLAFAFYQPYNQPLIVFLINTVMFVIRPRIYLWRRVPDQLIKKKMPKLEKANEKIQKEKLKKEKIKEISELLSQK